jgi:hypothetical protein
VATAAGILRYARWLEEIEPRLLDTIILFETGEDYRRRDLLRQGHQTDRDFRFGGGRSDRLVSLTKLNDHAVWARLVSGAYVCQRETDLAGNRATRNGQ